MATEAFGVDFWIGRIFLSKDKREHWRHVVIADIKGRRAKCHTLLYRNEDGKTKMQARGSWITLKNLATRWTTCRESLCGFCNNNQANTAKETARDE